MIYHFTKPKTFNKFTNADLKFLQDLKDEAIVFATVKGIPNCWFVHPVVNGRIDKFTILTPKQLDKHLAKFFDVGREKYEKAYKGIYG